jgi:hypothetical protein
MLIHQAMYLHPMSPYQHALLELLILRMMLVLIRVPIAIIKINNRAFIRGFQ